MQTKFPTNHKINGLVTAPLNVNNHKLIFIPFFLSSVFQEQNDMTDIIHNAMLGRRNVKSDLPNDLRHRVRKRESHILYVVITLGYVLQQKMEM